MSITVDPKERDKIRNLFGPYMFDNGHGERESVAGLGLSPKMDRFRRATPTRLSPVGQSRRCTEDDPTRAAAHQVGEGEPSQFSTRPRIHRLLTQG